MLIWTLSSPTRPHMSDDLEALLQEHRKFEPPPAFRATAQPNDPGIYERASADPEAYWADEAAKLEWMAPYQRVLDWKPPHAQWFVGGKINASVNCLDRHIRTARRNKAALVFEGEPGDRRTLTYWDLYVAVNQFGNVLRSLGVKKGRSCRNLPADDSRGGHRHARLRAHRRDPLGGVRRLLPRVAARPDQRLAVQGPHHLGRRLPDRKSV